MTSNNFIIREIKPSDNLALAKAIRDVLIEFKVAKTGTSFSDSSLDDMFEEYNINNAIFYVIENNGIVYGGAGIKKLNNYENTVCELQKMYFLPESRGIGLGRKMMSLCLKKAKEFDFKKCYLETLPNMENARKLYAKYGFVSIKKSLGDTGHSNCNIWMIKNL